MKLGDTIYLDHQATTPLDSRILEAMSPYMAGCFGNPHASEHIIGWRAMQVVEEAATAVGDLIGADPDEIIFTSGATEANNLALLGVARRAAAGKRKRILLGATEHKCVLEIGRVLRDEIGFAVSHIPVDSAGRLDMDALEAELDEEVLLVSVMPVNNEIGTIQDVAAISRIVSGYGSLLHCDAAQAPCALDLSSLTQHADLISLSGHKMYGPMGVGALFARRELHDQMAPIIHGGGQQRGLRSGTLPMPLCIGLGAAAKLMTGHEATNERKAIAARSDLFKELLEGLPCRVWVNGPTNAAERHPGNINLGFEGVQAADLLSRLQPRLAASTGSACTSGIPEPSHVLRAIGLSEDEAACSIRFSLGRHTTDDAVKEAARIIQDALRVWTH
ncbi:cysteine desulfurase family protein [Salipiger abyssi]|uniref:cysteine desulfurase family protein n=1 Tax=Salipiger abyssi TaxID=1250539 RepID=UPI000975C9B5|nr:cysteine desulfurase family protein [Salipiger abyssi]